MEDKFADNPGIADALVTAVGLHQAGELDEAERLYRSVLHRVPDHPDALHFLGVLLHQSGKSKEALELIQAAIAVCPSHPDAHSNLGNIFKDQGKLDEAEACYRQAIALTPDHVNAHYNLAIVLDEQGKLDEAVKAYRTVVNLQPDNNRARYQLGILLYMLGQVDQAVASFQKWLELDPDNPLALHMLAAWTGNDQPIRAQDDYVREIFDRSAETFDEHLERLDYQAPKLIAEVIRRDMREPEAMLDVLDAGCGTGLCGPLLRPYSGRLTGVDISSCMIDKARERGVYDDLIAAELTTLLEESASSYDLIVAADTLCYFGDLKQVLNAIAMALRTGGNVVFTLEHAVIAQTEDGFHLNPHGRYSHAEDYTQRVLKEVGLNIHSLGTAILRLEQKEPVQGLVILARKL
jgi:predicted TPR repeat methyltransferase